MKTLLLLLVITVSLAFTSVAQDSRCFPGWTSQAYGYDSQSPMVAEYNAIEASRRACYEDGGLVGLSWIVLSGSDGHGGYRALAKSCCHW